uniref:Pentatricopeptide repeat-containing protein n=1 Tax=Solanum tuberosum TaxID=4113 RepID=M1BAN9_SOLTU
MNAVVIPKHVAVVLKCQNNPLRALEIFNSVEKKHGFSHNLFTYKCIVEKLSYYGEFKAMEGVIEEARKNIDNRLLEGMYITAIRGYGKKGKVQQAVDVFEKMDFLISDHSAQLVEIADQLGDPPFGMFHRRLALPFHIVVLWIIGRHSIASRNCSAIRRLLFFTTDLILSFRAQHTGTKCEAKTFWRLTEWVR